MDLFKLGLRNLLGITLPGTILLLVFFYGLFTSAYVWNQPWLTSFVGGKDHLIVLLTVSFVVSYFLGSIMRLNAADRVDKKSSNRCRELFYRHYRKANAGEEQGEVEEELQGIRWKYLAGESKIEADEPINAAGEPRGAAVDEWIWGVEDFPYPIWQFRKLKLYHHCDVLKFFTNFKECMGIGKLKRENIGRKTARGREGKEFFNYCKTAILHASKGLTDELTQEVQLAEAHTRYYAGTHFGLVISIWGLVFLLVTQAVSLRLPIEGDPGNGKKIVMLLSTLSMVGAMEWMRRMILRRFRTLRLKEVDTVYDAFYLVNRNEVARGERERAQTVGSRRTPDPANEPESPRKLVSEKQEAREHRQRVERDLLLRKAHAETLAADKAVSGLSLEHLISAMKEGSKRDSFLSSIYFAGAEEDHSFFLKNDKVAIGLSVLPEDAHKAGLSKRHPHQQEVIVVLNGSLLLEVEHEGRKLEKMLQEGDMFVIGKDACHRIAPIAGKAATYLFVKTNPTQEPRGLDCKMSRE